MTFLAELGALLWASREQVTNSQSTILVRSTNTLLLTINTIFHMQKTSETLPLFTEETLQTLTLSLSDRLAKISHLLEEERGLKEPKVALSRTQLPSLLSSDQVFLSGRTLKEHSPQMLVQTFGRLSKRLPTLGVIQSNGNCLIQAGYSPKIESGFTLSDILEEEVSPEYFLSEKMINYLTERQGKKVGEVEISNLHLHEQ